MKPTKCSFPGCDNPILAKGLCNGHYTQQHKGQELRPLQPKLTLEQRFWQKVRKTGSCWEWIGSGNGKGYGRIWVDGRLRYAHRVAWELTNRPIPDGMFLDHRCGNHRCVNPDHLRVVTPGQNGQHRTGANKNNTSGVRGAFWDKRRNAWRAEVQLNGRTYHGGYHSTIEAADKAARALRARLFTHDDHHAEWLKNQKESTE